MPRLCAEACGALAAPPCQQRTSSASLHLRPSPLHHRHKLISLHTTVESLSLLLHRYFVFWQKPSRSISRLQPRGCHRNHDRILSTMLRYLRRKTRIKPRAEFRISRQTISTVRPNDASTISPGSEIRSPKLSRQAGIYSKLSYIIDTEFEPDCGICYDLDARAFPLSIYLSRLDRLITSACSACAMLCTVLKPWEESFVEEGAYGLSLRVFDEGLNIRAFNDEYSDILNVMLCAPDGM